MQVILQQEDKEKIIGTNQLLPMISSYPNNHVYESESGHVQEFDDTPGAERIHTYHRAGTFEEIHPDGSSYKGK